MKQNTWRVHTRALIFAWNLISVTSRFFPANKLLLTGSALIVDSQINRRAARFLYNDTLLQEHVHCCEHLLFFIYQPEKPREIIVALRATR
jgi:hypothetical protein